MSRSAVSGHRHARLQELLHEELNALLRNEVGDPALVEVVFTSVVLSVDYRNARVRYAIAGQPSPEKVRRCETALSRASAYLRAQLAFALDGKFVPQLRFSFDRDAPPPSLHQGNAE
jgi:ribosome-binding factor A